MGKKGGGVSVTAILRSFRPRPFPSLIMILHSCTLTHQLAVNFGPPHFLACVSMCVHLKNLGSELYAFVREIVYIF